MKLTKEVLKKMIKEAIEESYVTDHFGSDEDRSVDAMRRARPMGYRSGPKGPREPSVGGGNPEVTTLQRWQSMKGLLRLPGMAIGMATQMFKKMEELAATEPDIADALAKGQIYDNGFGRQREE